MTKFRIVTQVDEEGDQFFRVQERVLFFWFDVRYARSYNLEVAKEKLHELYNEHLVKLEQQRKRKAHKSKVVYGPYPP